MNAQTGLPGLTTAAAVDADLRSRGADYTPRMVARACVEALGSAPPAINVIPWWWNLRTDHLRVLDVCAGAGVYSSELARLWVRVLGLPREWLHITAVELHPPERENLHRWADEVIIGDYHKALRRPCPVCDDGVLGKGDLCDDCEGTGELPREYDLAIGNPDFKLLRAPERDGGYDVEASMVAQLLQVAPVVALLHRQQCWSKDGPGVSVRREYPPVQAWDIPGSIRFRAPGTRNPKTGKLYGADQHGYTWSVWARGYQGPTTTRLMDDIEQRSWTTRPGTETGVEAEQLGLVERRAARRAAL